MSCESKKIEEIKHLVEFKQCTNTVLRENAIIAFPVLPGSTDPQAI